MEQARDEMEHRVLRELLTTWQLSELFEHFKDEGVNVEELRLMRPHHVTELLRHYKLGVRVRFEHNFERWRRQMNRPLLDATVTCVAARSPHSQRCAHCCSNCAASNSSCHWQVPSQRQQTHQDRLLLKRSRLRTQSTESVECELPPRPRASAPSSPMAQSIGAQASAMTATALEQEMGLLKEMPQLTPQPKRLASALAANNAEAVTQPSGPPLANPEPPAATAQSGVCATQSTSSQANAGKTFIDPLLPLSLYGHLRQPPLSLIQILQASGPKGNSLIDYYREHHEFSNTQRALLISLIVNFFDDNDFHLSLNMSHHLENQILRFFPSEKLEYYRTEKRGKIYVKFCNMKRYRKDKPVFKRKWNKDVSVMPQLLRDQADGRQVEEDDCSRSYESWAEQPPNLDNMQIKTEEFSDLSSW